MLCYPYLAFQFTFFPLSNILLHNRIKLGAAVYDATMKGPEIIDMGMTLTLTGYSSLFMRFAWAVQPRNYLLFACHTFNVGAQLNQLRRAIEYKTANVPGAEEEMSKLLKTVAAAGVGLAALAASAGRIKTVLASEAMPGFVKSIAEHPAGILCPPCLPKPSKVPCLTPYTSPHSPSGPMTIFFWAPTSKWLLSVNNLSDLNKDTDKMSFAQQSALTSTGIIWTRYAMVITPVNYNLAIVNFVLGLSSGYHLSRKVNNDYFSKEKK